MSDISKRSNNEHFHCYQNIARSDCSDQASRAGGKDSEEGVLGKSAWRELYEKTGSPDHTVA